jgi:hypothetical protein
MGCVASNVRILNDELERIQKKTVVGCSKALFQHLLGGAEEKHDNHLLKYRSVQARFEPWANLTTTLRL